MRELLAVQAVDTSLDQARHALIHMPERAALIAAQAEAAAATAAQHEVRERLDAVRKEQRRFEDEAATVEAKAQSMNDQLYGGGKSVRELEAIQADVESLKRRQGELEDRAIGKMEEAEPSPNARPRSRHWNPSGPPPWPMSVMTSWPHTRSCALSLEGSP